MLKMLKELCALRGTSGDEAEVRGYIRKKAESFGAECRVDALGNLIAFKSGKKHDGPKLMISAHMDEVGFIVTDIKDDGYLSFDPVGGIDPKVALGRKITVGKNNVPAVVGLKAIHLSTPEERKKVPDFDAMYLDIGAKDKASAEKLVQPGDYCYFDSDWQEFGRDFLKVRAIDDRFGCAAMLGIMQGELPMDITFVFTVSEEIGCRGAFGSAFSVQPDIALVLEGTTSADFPGVDKHKKVTCINDGPVIGFMDRSTIYDRYLFEDIRNIAEKNGIKWQIKSQIAGGTDASAIQRSRDGVRVTNIAVPVRYIHSGSSVASLKDIKDAYKLAQLFVEELAEEK